MTIRKIAALAGCAAALVAAMALLGSPASAQNWNQGGHSGQHQGGNWSHGAPGNPHQGSHGWSHGFSADRHPGAGAWSHGGAGWHPRGGESGHGGYVALGAGWQHDPHYVHHSWWWYRHHSAWWRRHHPYHGSEGIGVYIHL